MGGSAKFALGRHSSGSRHWDRRPKLSSGHCHSSGRCCDAASWYANDTRVDNSEWNNSKHSHTGNNIAQRHFGRDDTGINYAEYRTRFYYLGRNARRYYARIDVTKRYSEHHETGYDSACRRTRNDYDAWSNVAQWDTKYDDTWNNSAPNDSSGQHTTFNHATRIGFRQYRKQRDSSLIRKN